MRSEQNAWGLLDVNDKALQIVTRLKHNSMTIVRGVGILERDNSVGWNVGEVRLIRSCIHLSLA